MYEITRSGMEALHESAEALVVTARVLGVFLSRYSEFVALEPGRRERVRRD